MLDAKKAVQIAIQKAGEMLGERAFNLEEIERTKYKNRDVWDITLSYVQNRPYASPLSQTLAQMANRNLEYKRFLIALNNGEFVAMKLRNVAAQ
jgi:hypothetical protein